MRVAIIAALPGELKPLVKTGWKEAPAKQKAARKWLSRSGNDQWVAVCAGMGADAARRAFAEAESDGRIDMLLSVGWAGALNGLVCAGSAHIASAVIDAQTGERFELANGERNLVLVSTARVAQEPEKRRLAEAYAASMVDMESATLARLGQMRGVPVICLKAISDDVGDALPDFNPFIGEDGQMRMAHLLAHVLVRPSHWRPLMRLGRASSLAARALASAILTVLSGPKDAAEINRTGNVDW